MSALGAPPDPLHQSRDSPSHTVLWSVAILSSSCRPTCLLLPSWQNVSHAESPLAKQETDHTSNVSINTSMYLTTGPEWYTIEASVQLQGLLNELLLLVAVHLAKASGCGSASGTASVRNERRNLRMSASSVRFSANDWYCSSSTTLMLVLSTEAASALTCASHCHARSAAHARWCPLKLS